MSLMRKSVTPSLFVLASVALITLSGCSDTVQDEDIDSSSEPYVPERDDSPTNSSSEQ